MISHTHSPTLKRVGFVAFLTIAVFGFSILFSGIFNTTQVAHAASCSATGEVNGVKIGIDQDEIPVTYVPVDEDTVSVSFDISASGHDDKTHFLVNDNETGICGGSDSCVFSNDNYSFNSGDKFTAKSRAGRDYIWGNTTVNCESSIIVYNNFGVDVSDVSNPTSIAVNSNFSFSANIEWWNEDLVFEYKFELVAPDNTVVSNTSWLSLVNELGTDINYQHGDGYVSENLPTYNLEPGDGYKLCVSARAVNPQNVGRSSVSDTSCSNVALSVPSSVDIKADGNNTDISKSHGSQVTLSWSSEYVSGCEYTYEGDSDPTNWDNPWPPESGIGISESGLDVGPIQQPGDHVFGVRCPAQRNFPPRAPSNLTTDVTAQQYGSYSVGSVDLTWSDNSNTETHFQVFRKQQGQSWVRVDSVSGSSGNTATLTDSTVDYGGSYVYRVRACNGSECSDYSNTEIANITDSGSQGQDECDPVHETCPDLQERIDEARKNNSKDNNYVNEGYFNTLASSILDFFSTAANAQNTEFVSDTITVEIGDGPNVDIKVNGMDSGGDDPKGVRLEPDETAEITWSGKTLGECANFAEPESVEDDLSAFLNSSYSPEGPDHEISGSVEVGPFDSGFEAELGMNCEEYTPPAPEAPSAPSNLTATPTSDTTARLNWTDNSTNETGHEIQFSTATNQSNFDPIDTRTSELPDRTVYTVGLLDDGEEYMFRLRACNSNVTEGNQCSDWVYASATTPLDPPTNLSVAQQGHCGTSISWTDNSSGETRFEISRYDQNDPIVVNKNVTSATDSVPAGGGYTYDVRACNDTVCSSRSNTDSVDVNTQGFDCGNTAEYAQSYYYGQSQYYTEASYNTPSCFTSETQILMADGSHKAIQNIESGDVVASYDLETDQQATSNVERLLVHEDVAGHMILNGSLEVTGEHFMWIENRDKWARAHTIEIGDTLLGPTGEIIEVETIDYSDEVHTVYNLQLEGPHHNYIAGGVLVHNAKSYDQGYYESGYYGQGYYYNESSYYQQASYYQEGSYDTGGDDVGTPETFFFDYESSLFSKVVQSIKGMFDKPVASVGASSHFQLVDSVSIYVEESTPPEANAGLPHKLRYNDEHIHSGASATDEDDDLASYSWAWESCTDYDGNDLSCPSLSDASGSISEGTASISGPSYTPDRAGHYTIELTVRDEDGNTDTDSVTESTTLCADGLDNDGDGNVDYKEDGSGDPDCDDYDDNKESAESFFFDLFNVEER